MEALGLRTEEFRALSDRMVADYSVENRGYAQLDDISDERQRAFFSDETCGRRVGDRQGLLA
jgi:hypothetical protein